MAIDKIFNDANVDGIADNIFGAVNNSVSEVKAMQQRKAAENVQMVVEAFKKIETNITEKFDNVTDVIEKRVLTIKDGRDGSSGSDGRNGRDGKPGRDGVNGKQGTPGTPGKDGVDGEDGVSVTNANIDFDGSLVISLSSGQQINVGEVVAPDLAEKIKIVSTMSTNGAVGIKDEGTSITAGVKIINFVGANVTATNSGDDVTVNVSSGTGTVTSVAATVPAFLSVAGSPVTTTGTLAISLSGTALPVANGGTGLTTGTSGGVLAYTAAGTLASSTALAASALVIGGGAGAAPSTTTTGTGVVTALGVNTGTAGAFVVNGGALGTPSSGTVTNLTGTASININGTVGATTPAAGVFTTLTANGDTTLGDASTDTILMTGAPSIGGAGYGMGMGFRNRIINGAMVIDQRNAGASLAITTNAQYSVDRFAGSVYSSGTGRYSLQQSTTVPAGFTNSLKMTVTTADASPTADYGYALQQSIEGLNCTDLNWGSANATTVTLSFWVYSSVTGNLPVVLLNSGFTRYYATTYSVASANTWTKISLTIVGDTSGTWLTTSDGGIYINFGFGAGSNRTASTANAWATSAYGGNLTSVTGATSVIATNGATWYITGVQLEKGATATAFDYRDYGRELIMCQRYYYKVKSSGNSYNQLCLGFVGSLTDGYGIVFFPVELRTRPTALEQTGTATDYAYAHTTTVTVCSAVPAYQAQTNSSQAVVLFTVSTGLVAGQGGRGCSNNNNASAFLAWSAEL